MAQKMEKLETPIKIQYGHDDSRVAVVFNVPVTLLALHPAEVDAMIAGLTQMKQNLAEHQQKLRTGEAQPLERPGSTH